MPSAIGNARTAGDELNPDRGKDRPATVFWLQGVHDGAGRPRNTETRRELSDDGVATITRTHHAWRGEPDAGDYEDVPGFCQSTILELISSHNQMLTSGRHVAMTADDTPFLERYAPLPAKQEHPFAEGSRLAG
jgi:type I restriction enzyme M protein